MQSPDELLLHDYGVLVEREFDFVVVGAGATGAAVTREICANDPNARVLVLDQGTFLLPGHVQNAGSMYQALMDTAVATPWRSSGELELVSQVPYIGGRTLFWSGAAPTPQTEQLENWPRAVVDDLSSYWFEARHLVGVRRSSDVGPEFGGLNAQLRDRVYDRIKEISCLVVPAQPEDLDAPLGMPFIGRSTIPEKYSAVAVLLMAAREHPSRVAVVPDCAVRRLIVSDGRATGIVTDRGNFDLGSARVILAMGTVENTRLVLDSFDRGDIPLAGRNLAANAASFFMCRAPRAVFDRLQADGVDLAALYLGASTADREMVLHLSAGATTDPARDRETMYRLLPDVFGDGTVDRLADPEHVVFLVNGVTEIGGGGRGAAAPGWVDVDADGETIVHFELDDADRAAWDALDRFTDEVLDVVAAGGEFEYWSAQDRTWSRSTPHRRMPFAMLESGTLWMGSSPESSVTDLNARLHAAENVYVTGGALFPRRGSWNPLLTMTAMAMRLGRHLSA